MKYNQLLTTMFADKVQIFEENNIVTGTANYDDKEFYVCGIVNEAPLDCLMSQKLAGFILDKISKNKSANWIIVVDTSGQQTKHFEELIGLNRYFAHLAKVMHYARSLGARIFGVINGKALGGALIATALNAEKIYALESAQIAVMWLEAMSKVIKIPLEKLQQLSKTSPIFAPGVENFVKLGIIEDVLAPDAIMSKISKDLQVESVDINYWRLQGSKRGGRNMANKIVTDILTA